MPVSVSPGILHLPKHSSHLLPSPSSSPEQVPETFPDLLVAFFDVPQERKGWANPTEPRVWRRGSE